LIIWLSSYPRSGNTFLRALLHNCLGQNTYSIYNDSDIGGDSGLTNLTGHCTLKHAFGSPEFDLTHLRARKETFFLKTHEPNRALVEPGDKVIYIVRDGREATLSFQKYLRNFFEKETTLLELSLGIGFPRGSWSDHVIGWKPKKHDDTLLLFFEELTANPKEAVEQVANFAKIPILKYNIPKFKDLQKINSRFFHQGKSDSYRKKYTDEAQISFLLASYREMSDLGYLENFPPSINRVAKKTLLELGRNWRQSVEYLRQEQTQLDEILARKCTSIELQIEKLQKKNKQIEQQNKHLQDKETQLNLHREKIQQQNENLKNKETQIKQHREKIRQQKEILQKNDAQITQHREKIRQQTESLQAKETRLKQTSSQLRQKSEQLQQKNELLARKENQIRQRDMHIDILKNSLGEQNKKIHLMQQSRSWRITRPLRAARLFFSDQQMFRQLVKKRFGEKT